MNVQDFKLKAMSLIIVLLMTSVFTYGQYYNLSGELVTPLSSNEKKTTNSDYVEHDGRHTYLNVTQPRTIDYEKIYEEKMKNRGTDIYKYNQFGLKEKVGTTRKNNNGGIDIYKYNQLGLKEKVITIDKKSPY